jgi:hypothetical protein
MSNIKGRIQDALRAYANEHKHSMLAKGVPCPDRSCDEHAVLANTIPLT